MCTPPCPCTARIRELEQRLEAYERLRCSVATLLLFSETAGVRWRRELSRVRDAAVRAGEWPDESCASVDVFEE